MTTPEKTPEKIGRYEIQGTLGQGAMGIVYKGYDPVLERYSAIKVMLTGETLDDELRDRFFQEARAVAKLNHTSIIAVYDMGEDHKQPFIAMEYLEGNDLKEIIQERNFVPFDQKLRFIRQICEGLDYAHSKGVVHRDIKPGNVFIQENVAKILDFGLARLASSEMTRSGMIMGSPYYMSPEQVKGIRGIDGRSDLFSVGVMLYELVSYCKPFEGDSPTSVCFQIVSAPHRPITEVLPGCPPQLAQIVNKALAKERDERFQSGADLATALEEFSRELPQVQQTLIQGAEALQGCLEKYETQYEDSSAPTSADATVLDMEIDLDRTQVMTDAPAGQDDFGSLLLEQAELTRRAQAASQRLDAEQPESALKAEIDAALQAAAESAAALEAASMEPSQSMLEDAAEMSLPVAPKPSLRDRQWLVVGGVVLAVLLGGGVFWFTTSDPGSPEPMLPAPPTTGVLALTVTPWARVDSITAVESGEGVTIDPQLMTPCIVSLPPGSYMVQVSNPQREAPIEFEVNVLAGETSVVHHALPDFDLEEAISAAIGD